MIEETNNLPPQDAADSERSGDRRLSTCSALRVTAEMIREMEAHTPFDLCDDPPKRWQWRADYLNESLQNPNRVCECCNIARDGEIMDHLSSPNVQVDLPPNGKPDFEKDASGG